ncbi:MAG TPA: F0F1 ATP synthase subunit B [Dehalococcoidia bacterium]|nr:F0F1 ATP synthase subunit B [Dehalococcoidia bacterium]
MVADAGLLDVNGTLIAELLAFILMVLAFAKWVYPPIIRMAESREKQIEAGVRAAEEGERRLAEVQVQAQRMLEEARERSREVIARAQREATAEAEEARAKGRTEAEAIVQQAREDIQAERDRAIKDLRTQVASLVVEATGVVIGQTLDERAHQRLIDDALNRVGASNGNERSG